MVRFYFEALRGAQVLLNISQQFSFSFQVVFGSDKDQEIPPGFMQGIAQGDMHLVENHIPPPYILSGLPEISVPPVPVSYASGTLAGSI
jgi:hypothetical protein